MTSSNQWSALTTTFSLASQRNDGMEDITMLSIQLATLILRGTEAVEGFREEYVLIPEVEATVIDNLLASSRRLLFFDCYQYVKAISESPSCSAGRRREKAPDEDERRERVLDELDERKEALHEIWKDLRKYKDMWALCQETKGPDDVERLREDLSRQVASPLLQNARQMKNAVDRQRSRIEAKSSCLGKALSLFLDLRSWKSSKSKGFDDSSPGNPKSPSSPSWSVSSFRFGRPSTHEGLGQSTSTVAANEAYSQQQRQPSHAPANSVSTKVSIAHDDQDPRPKNRVDSFQPLAITGLPTAKGEFSKPVLINPDSHRHRPGSNDIVTSRTSTQQPPSRSRLSIGTLLVTSVPVPPPSLSESAILEPLPSDLVSRDTPSADEADGGHPASSSPLGLADFQKFAESQPSYRKFVTPPEREEQIRHSSFWPQDGSHLRADFEGSSSQDGTDDGSTITRPGSNASGASGGTPPSESPTSLSPTSSTAKLHLFRPKCVPPKPNSDCPPSSNEWPTRMSSPSPIPTPSTLAPSRR